MTGALDGAVDLLEHSLAYTRGALVAVRPEHWHRATPCAAWDLADLLTHMDDALDAFTEAAEGHVRVVRPDETGGPLPLLDQLQVKACTLLMAWRAGAPPVVRVADRSLPAPILVVAAALEITVHGWDVGRATGRHRPIPAGLATGLLPLAVPLVGAAAGTLEFAPPRPVTADADPATRLLSLTGRGTEPPSADRMNHGVSSAPGGLAS